MQALKVESRYNASNETKQDATTATATEPRFRRTAQNLNVPYSYKEEMLQVLSAELHGGDALAKAFQRQVVYKVLVEGMWNE
jgi:hypothetical protein